MLSCKEISEIASKSLDTSIPLLKRLELKMHLMMCGTCRRYMKQLKFIQHTFQMLDKKLEHIKLPRKAYQRIEQVIKELQKPD